MAEKSNLEKQIAALENLRPVMGDEFVDRSVAELRAKPDAPVDTGGGAAVAGSVNTQGGPFIGRDIVIYQGRYEGHTPRTDAEARQIYCQYVAQQAGVLPLRGVDRGESDAATQRRSLSLSGVYTSLDTQLTLPDADIQEMLRAGHWKERSFDRERKPGQRRGALAMQVGEEGENMRPVSAIEAAILSRHWVLLGDPGSGKTTFVNYLTQAMAAGDYTLLPAWPENECQLLPVVVILRDFYLWCQTQKGPACANLLWEFICHDLKTKNLAFAAEIIENALENGQAMLLLDGLDEVPPDDARLLVRDCVQAFCQRYGRNRFLITCRVLSYEQNPQWQLPDDEFSSFKLASFDPEKIAHFIQAWYHEVAQKWNVPAERTQALAEKLNVAVRKSDLARLAPNPLLLTVMALVHTEYGELPDNRAQLYQQAVDVLLWRWEQEKSKEYGGQSQMMALLHEAGRDRNDLLVTLGKLAFDAHHSGGNTQDPDAVSGISHFDLLTALSQLHPTQSLDWARQVLETMQLRAGLLLDRDGKTFAFPHRTFQEYLAGTHLASQPDFYQRAGSLIESGAFWREVILLAVGHLAHNTLNRSMPLMLASELCPERERKDEIGWQRVVLAAESLLEMGLNRAQDSETGKSVLLRVRERLAGIVEGGLWTPTLRTEAGSVLGRLGDPRFDPACFYLPCRFRGQPEPALGFVCIPAGRFFMGSKKGDEEAYKDEFPQHEISLPEFWIARYPVTVVQFKAFVEDSGYKPRKRDCIAENPSWPVCYVSWHEARTYCEWLAVKLPLLGTQWLTRSDFPDVARPFWQGLVDGKFTMRLPTEAEWEFAARYGDCRRYPWGDDDWNEDCANIRESNINHPTPVGMYPKGATPTPLFDLSGNLFEWTLSLFEDYPYKPKEYPNDLEAPDDRAVRGGSWLNDRRSTRCSYRCWDVPDNFYDFIGFRIVFSASE